MFTGIVQDVGVVQASAETGGDLTLSITVGSLPLARIAPGDSIAVAGVCLTVTRVAVDHFSADVSPETRALTTLGRLAAGARVNLEPALRAGNALGGHLVSGHVDGVAEILSLVTDGRSVRAGLRVPAALTRYIATKGSVTLDGVSLTVNNVSDEGFDVTLIPHTCAVTTLGQLGPGSLVNIEVDQLARYVARLMNR